MASTLMRRSVLFVACHLLLAPFHQASAMGLMQAYDAALQNDPVYRAAVSEHQAGQQYQALGRAGLRPSIQYSYTTSENRAETTAPNFFGKPSTTYPEYTSVSSSLSLRQPLFNLDAAARYRQGLAQTQYSDAQFASRSQDLMIRLVTRYAEAKYAEDQLALYSAQRDTLLEQRRVNDRLFEKGEGTKTDMLETQSRLDVAQAQVIEASDNLATARSTLAALLGTEVTQLDGLVQDFTAIPLPQSGFDEWQALARQNNPELAAGRFALEAAEQEIRKSQAGHAPRLDLNASYSRSSAESLTSLNQDSTVRSIGLQFVLPLYAGGYVNAASAQAVANRDKASANLEASTNQVMIELRKQFSAVQSSVTKIAALQNAVNSAALLVQATLQSVKGGVRINLDVLNAQQQLVVAQRDLAQARYNYLISFLKLRVAAGTLNLDDLRTVAGYFSSAQTGLQMSRVDDPGARVPALIRAEVVLTPTPATPAPLAAPAAEAQATALVERWRQAWSERDVTAYLASYSPDFVAADGQARPSWEAARRKILARRADVRVTVNALRLERHGTDQIKASFLQDYAAGSYREQARAKTLRLVRRGADWLIAGEQQSH